MQHIQPKMRIIAVKGHSSESQSVATQLANYLKYKYSLIDQQDLVLTPAPLDSLPSSSTSTSTSTSTQSQKLNYSSFETLHQIANSHLRDSNPGVVIDLSRLSGDRETLLDQLKEFAKSLGAELILIQCQSSDQIDNYDSGVPTLTVDSDTSKPFIVEKFVSENLPFAFHQAADPIQSKEEKSVKVLPKGSLVKKSSFRHSREKGPEKIYRHLHYLKLYTHPATSKGRLICKICKDPISIPAYHCLDCDEFVFHKSCAEFHGNLEQVREDWPHYFGAREPKYEFPKEHKDNCKICKDNKRDFSYDCHDCLFETNIKGKYLPIVVNHESHAHPLNLIIAPLSLNYEFGCCGCGELAKSISYRCYDCNFNLHVNCVLFKRTSHKYGKHTFRLTYGSLEENCWDKRNCEVCKKETSPEQWFYYNPATESVTHFGCLSSGDQRR